MRSLVLLLGDEFKGFIKSKVMLALFLGLPLLVILFRLIEPDSEEIPLSLLSSMIVASIGGLLAAVMLSTSIVNEMNANVYDLYLIRPVKRWHIIASKYIAVMFCLTIASFLSFSLGIVIDIFTIGMPHKIALIETLKSLAISVFTMSIACAAGILIGLLVKSVPLAAILSIYLGQQFSTLAILPSVLLENIDPLIFSISVGSGVSIILLALGIFFLEKKQF